MTADAVALPSVAAQPGPLAVQNDLLLAPLEFEHADQLLAVIAENREHLGLWLPWLATARTLEGARGFIAHSRERASEHNGTDMAMLYEGRLIGLVHQHYIDWRNRSTSIGYWIDAGHQRRGLVTTSCRAITDRSFGAEHLNRVEIRCAADNTRSLRVAERLGFRREGVLREAEWLNGRFVDQLVFGALASEWRPHL